MSTSVLVIDDAHDVHTLLAARLKSEDVALVSAYSGEEGLALALANNPHLILLDVDMPGQSGLEICRILKEDPRTAGIPVIFLTGSTDVDTKVRGFDLGAVDYVTKPFHPAELRARVRSALRTKRYQDLLTARAQVDALTGLHNRGYFDDFLASAVAAAARDGRPTSLVMTDLDHFKRLNDQYGHPFGDLVLQRAGEVIGACVRSGDAACRYGGEEMAVILPGVASSRALEIAERIRNAFSVIELVPKGQRVVVTASFGVAEVSEVATRGGGWSAGALVAAADAALYEAKRAGRDRVCRAALPSLPPSGSGAPRVAA